MEKWEKKLKPAGVDFVNGIIKLVPEEHGARNAFITILHTLAKPTEEEEERLKKLQALEHGGVDNWGGYDFAMEAAGLFDDDDEENKDD